MSKSNRTNGSSGSGSGGPRTPAGKRRSAQNASKHRIFAGRILSNEEKEAAKLFAQFQQDLQPESSLEIEIISDLVQNRLQARRIDKHYVYEVDRARVPTIFEELGRVEERYRSDLFRPAGPPAASKGEAVRGSLHPVHCLGLLHALKSLIEDRGAKPEEDVPVLERIYGGELTMAATYIMLKYKQLAIAQSEGDRAETTEERSLLQSKIVEQLKGEIDSQSHRLALEGVRDQIEMGTDRAPFLTDSQLSQFERYRSGNTRQFMRLIAAFERIRRLGNPEDGPGD